MSKSTQPPRRRKTGKQAPTRAQARPGPIVIAGTEIIPEQVIERSERTPIRKGPWRQEPDRIAWRDPVTGYACLVQRFPNGTLAGFVGLRRGHPLFGFAHDAIPAELGLQPHRGLDYSAHCEHAGLASGMSFSICHVSGTHGTRETARDIRSAFAHEGRADLDDAHDDRAASAHRADDAWWLGFSTDRQGDFQPSAPFYEDRSDEDGVVYRDLDYVAGELFELVRQLHAIELEFGSASGKTLGHDMREDLFIDRATPRASGKLLSKGGGDDEIG